MTLEKKGQGLSNGSKKALYCTKNARQSHGIHMQKQLDCLDKKIQDL